MRKIVAMAALASALVSSAALAEAPTVTQCTQAYEVLDHLKHKAQGLEFQAAQEHRNGSDWYGLGNYAANFRAIDFDKRAQALADRFPDKFDAFTSITGQAIGSVKVVENMILEGPGLRLDALMAPEKIFSHQRGWFADAHACDVEFNLSPVLGAAPDTKALMDMVKAQIDRENKQKEDHLANLSDFQCTVRFGVAAQLSPANSPAQAAMAERYNAGLAKTMPSFGDMPPDRIKERLQGEAQDVATHLQSKSMTPQDLVDEVHACERRFGMSVSDLRVQN
ncbi:MAG: hypothetical protein JOZ72_03595 [Alphaproteobacteria bacterium]|nr:hypothetical protein [Alphaproteobacteria bacterium]